jgi:hypothetical protein
MNPNCFVASKPGSTKESIQVSLRVAEGALSYGSEELGEHILDLQAKVNQGHWELLAMEEDPATLVTMLFSWIQSLRVSLAPLHLCLVIIIRGKQC